MPALFSYDPLLSDLRDRLRFHTGDTKSEQPLLDDQELDALIALWPAPETPTGEESQVYELRLAARAADAIAAKFARDADTSFETQRVALSAKFAQYRSLAQRLRDEAVALTREGRGGWGYVERW